MCSKNWIAFYCKVRFIDSIAFKIDSIAYQSIWIGEVLQNIFKNSSPFFILTACTIDYGDDTLSFIFKPTNFSVSNCSIRLGAGQHLTAKTHRNVGNRSSTSSTNSTTLGHWVLIPWAPFLPNSCDNRLWCVANFFGLKTGLLVLSNGFWKRSKLSLAHWENPPDIHMWIFYACRTQWNEICGHFAENQIINILIAVHTPTWPRCLNRFSCFMFKSWCTNMYAFLCF